LERAVSSIEGMALVQNIIYRRCVPMTLSLLASLVVLFVSSYGVSAPEPGTNCMDAVAQVVHQGLQEQSVEIIGNEIIVTMVREGFREKVAIIGCVVEDGGGGEALE
jgi:hypothetical protein